MKDVLGTAAVEPDSLRTMVADLLGQPDLQLGEVTAEVVPYEIPAITTGGRYWVSGTTPQPWRIFVKHVHEWSRSPFFAHVPEAMRELARRTVPWRTEGAVYRSRLAEVLPEGLALPRVLGVHDIDELAYTVWLEEVPTLAITWDLARYQRAAYLLGRFAARPAVRALGDVGGHRWDVRFYVEGRLMGSVVPALQAAETWEHPLVAPSFGPLRDRTLAVLDRLPALADELRGFPLLAAHGDASPNNLLVRPDRDGFTLIDFNFFGLVPVGFDLGQLLVGDVQIGKRDTTDLAERDRASTLAYHRGLAAEGVDLPVADVERAHALHLLLFSGLSAIPFELLEAEPTRAQLDLAESRAELARYSLDLLDATG